MTTIPSTHEYDSLRSGKTSSPAPDSGYVEHQKNGGQGYLQPSGPISTGSSTGGKPEDERKLFVGGLTWDTTQDDLREYFSEFGNVLDCSIKQDPVTGRSRGFAFLVFDSKDIVEKILSQSEHLVKGRKVDPKPAHRRTAVNNTNQMMNNNNNHYNLSSQSSLYGAGPTSTLPYGNMSMTIGANANTYSNNRKVFIGGLDPSFPDSQLREYFSKFGKIDEIDLPFDKEKNERRPFCFISFSSEQVAQEVLRQQRHTIGEITVDVKPAKPKTLNNQQQQQQLQQHMYDPYGQVAYAAYNTAIPAYGANPYTTTDPYANWSPYNYSHPPNTAGYPYTGPGAASVSSPNANSYQQYPHQPSAQYPYPPNSNAAVGEYYQQYEYGVAPPTGGYTDPNAYGSGYEYSGYYQAMNAGGNPVQMADDGNGQQPGNTLGNPTEFESDNRLGKARTAIHSSPTYHPYARS